MKFLRTASMLGLVMLAMTACDDATGVEVADLAGSWNATRFEYSDDANPTFSIDAISDAGGSVTLDVQESGAFSGMIDIPGLTPQALPIGGTFSIDGDTLTVDFDAQTESYGLFGDFTASFSLNGDVLTFINTDTTFDFPDTLEEQAGIGARGEVNADLSVRLVR